MAKIIKLRGPIREFTVVSGGLFKGGLLTICCSRVGAYSRETFLKWGGGANKFSLTSSGSTPRI